MMRTFFAPAVLAAVPWITEGTILEEFVDFEILAAGLSSSRSRRSRLGRTSGSSRWWEPRPRWPPGSPPAAGDHVWLFKRYIRNLIVWWRNRTMVAGWQIRSLDLARLLCHDGHLVGIVAPCESSDHRADHRLHGAHLVSRTIVILFHLKRNFKEFESSATQATTDRVALVDAGGAAASHGEEELQTEVGDVPQGEGVLAVQVDSLDSDKKRKL